MGEQLMPLWTGLATWRGPSVNHGGPMVEQRGLVIHIAEGYYEGTIGYENHANKDNASSHFVCGDGAKGQGHDGDLAQLLDTDMTAFTQRAGNGHWLSVECAGFTPHPLTPAQCESVARLLARAHKVYGVPLQLANGASGRGLGYHSMGGAAWGHLDCPGPAIIAQRPAILARAIEIVNGPGPTPPPPQEVDMPIVVRIAGNPDAPYTGDPTLKPGAGWVSDGFKRRSIPSWESYLDLLAALRLTDGQVARVDPHRLDESFGPIETAGDGGPAAPARHTHPTPAGETGPAQPEAA